MKAKINKEEIEKEKKVLVTDNISEEGIKKLREFADVDIELELSKEELKERISNYGALIVRSGTQVTKEIIEAGKTGKGKLKVIGRAGVGMDNIAVETATEKGIIVVNAPEANTISAAEHTIAMLLSLSRKIPAANASLKSKRWDREGMIRVVRTPGGRRRIPESEILRIQGEEKRERKVVGYARVSSLSQKDDLERQERLIKNKGVEEVLTDIGSGLNEKRRNYKKILRLVMQREISKIIISYPNTHVKLAYTDACSCKQTQY